MISDTQILSIQIKPIISDIQILHTQTNNYSGIQIISIQTNN